MINNKGLPKWSLFVLPILKCLLILKDVSIQGDVAPFICSLSATKDELSNYWYKDRISIENEF